MKTKLKCGSLYSGVGGFELGLVATDGFEIEWQVENDPDCLRVLEKGFPNVTRRTNVKTSGKHNLSPVDLICGGFPCQDLSNALNGSKKGIYGEQSGLVFEMARIADELKPKWLFIENVPAIKRYRAELESLFSHWRLEYADLNAQDYGALTRRKRTLIVGHPRNRSPSSIFSHPIFTPTTSKSRRQQDVLPMCLPWKGGVSLERLGSCVIIEGEKTDPIGVRKSDGLSRRVDRLSDSKRYLMLGNALPPIFAYLVGRAILDFKNN